jgi:hypothetical protein
MNRRFLFPLAAGVVGLVAISPVLAAEQSTPAANESPAKATTTTMPPDDSSGSASDSGSGSGAESDTASGSSSSTATTGKGSGPTATTGKGSGSTATTGKGSSGSTGTTGPGSGSGSGTGGRSSSVCDPPEINKSPAPQVGDTPQTYEASEAGSVDVERLSETELRIVKATANDGWTEQVAAASGPRVTVKFTRQGQSPTLIRFAASMDQKGTMIHTRVTSCG